MSIRIKIEQLAEEAKQKAMQSALNTQRKFQSGPTQEELNAQALAQAEAQARAQAEAQAQAEARARAQAQAEAQAQAQAQALAQAQQAQKEELQRQQQQEQEMLLRKQQEQQLLLQQKQEQEKAQALAQVQQPQALQAQEQQQQQVLQTQQQEAPSQNAPPTAEENLARRGAGALKGLQQLMLDGTVPDDNMTGHSDEEPYVPGEGPHTPPPAEDEPYFDGFAYVEPAQPDDDLVLSHLTHDTALGYKQVLPRKVPNKKQVWGDSFDPLERTAEFNKAQDLALPPIRMPDEEEYHIPPDKDPNPKISELEQEFETVKQKFKDWKIWPEKESLKGTYAADENQQNIRASITVTKILDREKDMKKLALPTEEEIAASGEEHFYQTTENMQEAHRTCGTTPNLPQLTRWCKKPDLQKYSCRPKTEGTAQFILPPEAYKKEKAGGATVSPNLELCHKAIDRAKRSSIHFDLENRMFITWLNHGVLFPVDERGECKSFPGRLKTFTENDYEKRFAVPPITQKLLNNAVWLVKKGLYGLRTDGDCMETRKMWRYMSIDEDEAAKGLREKFDM